MLGNTNDKWGMLARGFHGIGAVLIAVLLGHGWWMVTYAAREARVEHYSWHASIGYALLVVTLARLVWRWLQVVPQPLADSKPWERWAAHLGHWGLYVLMLATAILGWGLAGTFRTPLDATLFGFIPVPAIVSDAALHGQLEELHEVTAWTLAALVVVHIAAALYHQFVKRDSVLRRMY